MAKIIIKVVGIHPIVFAWDTITKTIGAYPYYNIGSQMVTKIKTVGKTSVLVYTDDFNVVQNTSFIDPEHLGESAMCRAAGYGIDQYCVGTSLIVITAPAGIATLYPVTTGDMVSTDTPSSPTCNFSVNDISIVAITQVTSGSDTIASIIATSTNFPLTYSIDGVTYQSGSDFTISASGSFVGYAKDSRGYIATLGFTVTNAASYGLKYSNYFFTDRNERVDVKLFDINYTGSVTEVQFSDSPVIIRYMTQGDDKYKDIKGSECVLSLMAQTNYQFLEFFTAEDKKYKVEIYKVSVLVWSGFVSPEAYSEPYTDTPYPVTLTFVDGLGLLKRRDFTTTGSLVTNIKTQMEVIKICLLSTGLEFPIYTSISIYEEAMADKSIDGDPLTQAAVNTDAFYNPDGTPFNCYDVLESILIPYGARIYLENGAWHIINVDEMVSDYYQRRYSAHGVYESTDFIIPGISTTATTAASPLVFIDSPQIEIIPAYKQVQADITLNRTELIKNPDFVDEGENGIVFKSWEDTFGILEKAVQSDENNKVKNFARILGDGETDGWSQYISAQQSKIVAANTGIKIQFKTKFKIVFSSNLPMDPRPKFEIKVDALWMNSTGAWVTTQNFISPTTVINQWFEVDITSDPVTNSGALVVNIYQAKIQDVGYDAQYTDYEYFNIDFIENNVVIPAKKTITKISDSNYVYKPSPIKPLFADFPEYQSAGRILKNVIYTLADGSRVSALWARAGVTEATGIIDLLLERILYNHSTPTQKLTGTLYGDIKFSNTLTDPNNPDKYFVFTAMEWDVKKCEYKSEFAESKGTIDTNQYRIFEDGSPVWLEDQNTLRITEG